MKKNKLIGSGKWGKIYQGCYNDKCKELYARKNSNNLDAEYKIMKTVYNIAPNGVIEPYSFEHLNGRNSIYMRYLKLNSKNKKITMRNLRYLISKIIITLLQIQKKYPSFRHNDLHWENVFNTKGNIEILIGDFGFANINRPGLRNPVVTSGSYKVDWGIFPKNNKNYDIHLLLNSIHNKGTNEVKRFIETLIPKEYIGSENKFILNSRMRYNINHNSFPTMIEIFSKVNSKR